MPAARVPEVVCRLSISNAFSAAADEWPDSFAWSDDMFFAPLALFFVRHWFLQPLDLF